MYVSIKVGNTVEASISRDGIGSRANIREHQEGNTVDASIFPGGIDSRPMYVSIDISRLVKLVSWDTL